MFNVQNVIKEATRITPSTETLIDVIATNKPDLLGELEYCRWALQPSTCNPQVKTKKTAAPSHYSQELQTI